MKNLREKIQEINANTNLSTSEKSKKIFELMNPNFNQNNNNIEKFNYTNIGCKHYKRKCLMKADCCNIFVPCRLCHDEKMNHKINRFNTKIMKCKICDHIQDVNQKCNKCNTIMGNYYCNICKFWSNTDESIYHCEQCGICRKGNKEDFFHCKICNCCISISIKDTHKCLENSLNVDCSICNENLFNSVKKNCVLQCGHYIHNTCLTTYINNNNYQCPVCKKSIHNMSSYWKSIDTFLENQIMPIEYNYYYCTVYCNDCTIKTYSNYHFQYIKCNNCKGYNTCIDNIYNISNNKNKLIKLQKFLQKKYRKK